MTRSSSAAGAGRAGPVRRLVVRWLAIPLTSLTLKAWGRCWISTETAYRLNMLWANVALWGFREEPR